MYYPLVNENDVVMVAEKKAKLGSLRDTGTDLLGSINCGRDATRKYYRYATV